MGLKAGHCMTGEPAASVDSHIVPARADQEGARPAEIISRAAGTVGVAGEDLGAPELAERVGETQVDAGRRQGIERHPPGGAVTLMVSGGALSIVTVIEETGIDQPMSPVRARAVIE